MQATDEHVVIRQPCGEPIPVADLQPGRHIPVMYLAPWIMIVAEWHANECAAPCCQENGMNAARMLDQLGIDRKLEDGNMTMRVPTKQTAR